MSPFWRQVFCRLRRHQPILHVAEGRIWLRCTECLYETPGVSWIIPPPPAARSVKVRRFKKRLKEA